MKRTLFAVAVGLLPWTALADPVADSAERLATDPDCALEVAEAYSARLRPGSVVDAGTALAEAGRIDAAKRLLQLLKDEQEQYEIDYAVLEFFAKERRFDDAQAYIAALPADGPKWSQSKRSRASVARRDFNWLWVSNSPEESVLETLDWIAANVSSPESQSRLRASLISMLAEQGLLDRAYQELQRLKPNEPRIHERALRVRRANRVSRVIISPIDKLDEPSRIAMAADLVWISLLMGRSDLATQINADFEDKRWRSELRYALNPLRHSKLRYWQRTDVRPESAISNVAEFAKNNEVDMSSYYADLLVPLIHIKRGEFAQALELNASNDYVRREVIAGLEAAGRYQEIIELVDGTVGPKRLMELALKQRDFALVQRIIDDEDNEKTRDDFRRMAFNALTSEDATEPDDIERAYKFARAMKITLQLNLLAIHAATLPKEDREFVFDRAGIEPSIRVRLMPLIAIYAAANDSDWGQVVRLVNGLSQFERQRLNDRWLAQKALSDGEVEIALLFDETKKRSALVRRAGSYNDAILALALNGEGARALGLLPKIGYGRKAMLSYAIWALQ